MMGLKVSIALGNAGVMGLSWGYSKSWILSPEEDNIGSCTLKPKTLKADTSSEAHKQSNSHYGKLLFHHKLEKTLDLHTY